MTVIAYRDGTMAADRGVYTERETLCGELTKIHLLPDGMLWGASGGMMICSLFERWLLSGRPQTYEIPEFLVDEGSGYEAIVVEPNGTIFIYDMFTRSGFLGWRNEMKFSAIGIGRVAALAAMHAGRAADDACIIAGMIVACCGGAIDVLTSAHTPGLGEPT